MSTSEQERVRLLAARVMWLDRYRRVISVVFGLAVFAWLAHAFDREAGAHDDVLGVVGMMLAVMCAAMTWWLAEVGFAWVAALWDHEHDVLSRARGVPRARVIRRD